MVLKCFRLWTVQKTKLNASKRRFAMFCNNWWKPSFPSLAVVTYPQPALLSRKSSFDLHRATNRTDHENEAWGAWDFHSQMTHAVEAAQLDALLQTISSVPYDEAEGRLTSAADELSAVSGESEKSVHQRNTIRIMLVIISSNHNEIHLNY